MFGQGLNFGGLTGSAGFDVDFLVVAGGGSGGSQYGGGGGAGGLKTTTTYGGSEASLSLLKSTPYNVTVGEGGVGVSPSATSNNGQDSLFDSITSKGGGYGGKFFGGSTPSTGGNIGGSGGGGGMGLSAGVSTAGGIATPTGQGSDGGDGYRGSTGGDYLGGGGGGSSAPGQDGNAGAGSTGGFGGAGSSVLITGTALSYAGGGGGSGSTTGGAGGAGGGGIGSGNSYNGATINGTINTGGGGGGMLPYGGELSGSGGSGIVILRYPTADVSSYAVTGTLDTTADTAYPVANTAYYKLNGDALDSSGNGYNGTWNGTETYAAGRFGQAAVFNGSSSYIYRSSSFLPMGSASRTFSFWTKLDTHVGDAYFMSYGNGATGQFFSPRVTPLNQGGYISFMGYAADLNSNVVMTTGEWMHLCYTYNGTTLKIYKNAVEIASGNLSLSTSQTRDFIIGARDYNGSVTKHIDGSIDQIRIFNSALSAGNVTQLYNEGTVVESTDGTDSILQFIGGSGDITFS